MFPRDDERDYDSDSEGEEMEFDSRRGEQKIGRLNIAAVPAVTFGDITNEALVVVT